MMDFLETPPGRLRNGAMLVFFLALCGTIASLGELATSTSVNTWYAALQKPAFNPPNWVFGPVWAALYICIAVAGWQVWRVKGFSGARPAFRAYWLQLGLNLAWPFLFFGTRVIALGLAGSIALTMAVIVTGILFWRIDKIAGGLFIPYAVWVAFATVLNAEILRLN